MHEIKREDQSMQVQQKKKKEQEIGGSWEREGGKENPVLVITEHD